MEFSSWVQGEGVSKAGGVVSLLKLDASFPGFREANLCAIGVLDVAMMAEQSDWLLIAGKPGVLSPSLSWCQFSWGGEAVCGRMMLGFPLLV